MLRCNRCGSSKALSPCPYSDVDCAPRMTWRSKSESWMGRAERTCGEHHSTGSRAWCLDDQTWCYPSAPCSGCETVQERIQDAIELLTEHGYQVTPAPPAEG